MTKAARERNRRGTGVPGSAGMVALLLAVSCFAGLSGCGADHTAGLVSSPPRTATPAPDSEAAQHRSGETPTPTATPIPADSADQ